MSDKSMRDEQDALLTRLFAEQEQTLSTTDFTAQLLARLERENRRQRAYSIASVIAILVLGAAMAPWITQVASVFVELMAAATDVGASVLNSPVTWVAAGALVLAFLPFVYVWRAWQD
jgi:uncharacterized membrane protein